MVTQGLVSTHITFILILRSFDLTDSLIKTAYIIFEKKSIPTKIVKQVQILNINLSSRSCLSIQKKYY